MALIAKCTQCRRLYHAPLPISCPDDGCTVFRFIVDWWVDGRNAGRKQKTLPKGTPREEAEDIEASMKGPKGKPLPTSAMATVADLFPPYLDYCRQHKAKGTTEAIERLWRIHLSGMLGGVRAVDIETSHYSLFQKRRAATGVKNSTVNTELNYFSGFLTWCRREKKVPVGRVEYQRLKAEVPLPIVLIPDEVSRMVAAAKSEPFWHAVILCLYVCGLRIHEVRFLKPEDFDFGNMSVRMLQKGGTWKILPIDKELMRAVKKLIRLRGIGREEFIFSFFEGKPFRQMAQVIKRIRERAGIEKKVNPHLFRHSFATNLLEQGVNLRTIQEMLGHKQISTTTRYTHVTVDHMREAQKMITLYGKPKKNGKVSTVSHATA